VNNIPIFPPAERFGLAMIALIRAIAAQAGWFVPRWLVAKVEAEIWGFVEALSLLVAVVAEQQRNQSAADPVVAPVPAATVEQATPPARHGTPGRRRPAARPGPKPAAPERGAQPRRQSRPRRSRRRPSRTGTVRRHAAQRPYRLTQPPRATQKISA